MTKKQGLEPTASGPRKWLIGGVVAAVTTVSAVVGFAGPAAADPVTTYVAVGSDTTQDISDQFALSLGLGILGSWDAVDPTGQGSTATNPEIEPKVGCIMGRPNGSTAGLNALRYSINQSSTAGPLAPPPSAGCVDVARSSSGPGTNVSTTGLLQYIPFALDAVTSATGPATAVTGTDPAVATAIVDADSFSFQNLKDLYGCAGTTQFPNGDTIGTVHYTTIIGPFPDGDFYTADPNAVADTVNHVIPIHLKVPQANSGTTKFWLGQMSGGNQGTCVQNTYLDSGGVSHSIEEHNGAAYAADANAIGPFSVAQFIAQSNGHNPRLHNVAIHNITPLPTQTGKQANPTTGSIATGDLALNTNFTITREVFNIVELARITTGNAKFDSGLSKLYVGATSRLCALSFQITQYGFATLATAPLGHTCGAVTSDLQAWATL